MRTRRRILLPARLVVLLTLAVLPSDAFAAGQVSGHVYDAGSTSLEGICVDAYPSFAYPDRAVSPTASTKTAADGSYTIAAGVGPVWIRYWDCAHTPPTLADQDGFTNVTTGDLPGVEAHMPPGGSASGNVRDALGNPVANACVNVSFAGSAQLVGGAVSGPDGTYTTGGLPTGVQLQANLDTVCGLVNIGLLPFQSSASFTVTAGQNSPGHDVYGRVPGTDSIAGPAARVAIKGGELSRFGFLRVHLECLVGQCAGRLSVGRPGRTCSGARAFALEPREATVVRLKLRGTRRQLRTCRRFLVTAATGAADPPATAFLRF